MGSCLGTHVTGSSIFTNGEATAIARRYIINYEENRKNVVVKVLTQMLATSNLSAKQSPKMPPFSTTGIMEGLIKDETMADTRIPIHKQTMGNALLRDYFSSRKKETRQDKSRHNASTLR